MKILTAAQIREADAHTIANEPIRSIDLMERAANACAGWIMKHFEKDCAFRIFCGTGNNGGDGLVIARKLFENGYKTEVLVIRFSDNSSADFLTNEKRLKQLIDIPFHNIRSSEDFKYLETGSLGRSVYVDCIFGTGISRPAEGLAADVIKEINKQKNRYKIPLIAIDVPSGLFCENNAGNKKEHIINADYTLTFEVPKTAFMFAENEDFVGDWQLIPIGLDKKFISEIDRPYYFITADTAAKMLKKRKKFSHKGSFGHALLLCGSYGKIGAAVLAARACLRAGAGLLTVHLPRCGYQVLQTALPEAMVSIDSTEHIISELPKLDKYNSIGIGPGIGTEKQSMSVLKLLIQNSSLPLVIDADAINIIAENKTWLSFLPKNCIFTPHPKEFERLAGPSINEFERLEKQVSISKKFSIYIVLKGAHTAISCPGGEVYFNSSGNPGMATAGTGDVLTGFITGILAQGYNPKQACILAVYLHGRAADIAARQLGYEAMIAGDLIENIGNAFLSVYTDTVE